MNDKLKNPSPLVKAVLALDDHFANLIRLSEKIEENDLKTDGDIEQARKLMLRFAEASEGISAGVIELGQALQTTRSTAEAAAEKVGKKANIIQSRQGEEAKLAQMFQNLSDKVGSLNQSLVQIKPTSNDPLSDVDRAKTMAAFGEVASQLQPLITEAESLRDDAQRLKLKGLEQQASSLAQHLINVKEKIASVTSHQN